MNSVKYKFHPDEYELGENEKFYSDMEAKGWRLVKRERYLSKFVPAEPCQLRYRVEVSSPEFLGEDGLSEGQLTVFEDCGWEYVTSRSFLHIFRAPAGSGAPEFYSDPVQQAQTLKKVCRGMWISWAIILIALAIGILITFFSNEPWIDKPWERVLAVHFKRFVRIPTHYVMYWFWMLWAAYELIWSTWKINRTYRRLKRGIPLDHAPKGNRILHKLFHPGLLCLSALCLLLTIGQLISTQSEDLPAQPDGPYIMLCDVNWEGERTTFMGQSSGVTHAVSPLADYWETVEYIRTQTGGSVWLRQYVYRLRFPGMSGTLAQSLMDTPILSSWAAFSPVEAEGFDAVWAAGRELVAVKGDMVAYVMFLGANDDGLDDPFICAALQAAWES